MKGFGTGRGARRRPATRRPFGGFAVLLAAALVGLVMTAAPAASRPAARTVPAPAGPPPGPPDWTAAGVRIEPLPAQDQEIDVTGLGAYRGAIVLQPGSGSDGLTVVNQVAFDDYLRGIAEVPSDWPAAALQAQAIAARTYALHTLAIGQPLCATDACQVYAGLAKERADTGGWAAAVAATEDQVLLFRGAPALTMYSSSNGGQMVTGGQPYLRAGPDPDDAVSPVHVWHSSIALSDLQTAFSLPGPVTGVSKTDHDTVALTWTGPPTSTTSTSAPPDSTTTTTGSTTTTTLEPTTSTTGPATTVTSPTPTEPASIGTGGQTESGSGPSGDAAPQSSPTATTGTTGTTTTTSTTAMAGDAAGGAGPANRTEVATADFVSRLNATHPAPDGLPLLLPSSRFDIRVDTGAGTASFDGKGFGHGIGMSQFGALGKARRGLKAADILAAYYGGLRPVVAPAGMIPGRVPVVLDDGRSTVTVTAPGRFRVVAADGTVLTPLAHGPWQFTAAGAGRVRIVPPEDQRGPLTVVPVGARFTGDPVSGGIAEIHVRLSLPAVVRAAVVPASALAAPGAIPGPPAAASPATAPSAAPSVAAPPVASADAPPADPGEMVIQVPFAPGTTPTWDVKIEADAGAGRVGETALLLDVRVSSLPPPPSRRHGHVTDGALGSEPLSRSASTVPLAATIALLALAWAITARPLRPRRPAGAGSDGTRLP